jgi:hypothetical protein
MDESGPESDEHCELALAVRRACFAAALDGYQRAQLAGLCPEGDWKCAVDAMGLLDRAPILQLPEGKQPPPCGPASA